MVERLRSDSELRVALKICRHYRIPHSRFLGWPEIDQAKAIAYEMLVEEEQRDVHGPCGQRMSEWHDEHGKQLKDPPFDVVHIQCPACELLADEHEVLRDSNAPAGTYLAFRRVGAIAPPDA